MTILPFFSVFDWSTVLIFSEDLAEIAAFSQSAGMSDICNGILPVYEHFASFV